MLDAVTLTAGHRFAPVQVVVTAEEVQRYLQVVGDDAALYQEPAAPVPPLLLLARALAHLMEQVELRPGSIHGGQDCEFLGRAAAGRPLTLETSVERAATRQGQRILVVEMLLRDAEAELLRSRATLLVPLGNLSPTSPPPPLA
jgi:capsular polysaccharide biosynthesis protein